MRDILERNGIKVNRNGFINCPFHTEKTASMKVYPNSFHCFGCGVSGDIFDMEMQLNRCDFRTAYELLGGREKPSWRSMVTAARAKRERQATEQMRKEKAEQLRKARLYIAAYRIVLSAEQPFSELWCYCKNKLIYQEYLLESMLELDK